MSDFTYTFITPERTLSAGLLKKLADHDVEFVGETGASLAYGVQWKAYFKTAEGALGFAKSVNPS